MTTIRFKLSTKIALVAFFLSLLGIAALAIISYQQSNAIFKQNLVTSTSFEVKKIAKIFTEKIYEAKKDILFLAGSEPIQGILRTTLNKYNYDEQENMDLKAWEKRLTKLFKVIIAQNEAYYQLRLIGVNNQGKEIIRVEKQKEKIIIAKKENLQFKHKRDYYLDTIKLPPHKLYLSKINLNKEHHVIAVPHIPTIRIATPIYSKDKLYAILVVNINIAKLLEFDKFDTIENQRTFIANEEGYYIYNKEVEKTFSFEFGGKKYRLQDDYNLTNYFKKKSMQNYSFFDKKLSSALSIQRVNFSKERYVYIMQLANSKYFKNEAQNYTKILVFYILIIAIIIAILIAFLLKRFTMPITKLTNIAKKITHGKKINLNILDIKTGDEIQELSTAFKYMVTSLSKSQQKLQNLAHNLEAEVTKKTKELYTLNSRLEEQIQEIQESKQKIEQAHRQTQESIEYAALIQNALLPQTEKLSPFIKGHFIFWEPKDTVGGDIYFISEISQDEIILMVIDGAGHGVAGAFLTMLVKAIQERIISNIKEKKLPPSPAHILSYFNKSIKTMLQQEKETKSNIGFDGAILYYNKATATCTYAGAKIPLYLIKENKLEVIQGDRKHVGFVRTPINQHYTEYHLTLSPDTKLYIATDGIIDQEGSNGIRFGKKRFEALLHKIYHLPFAIQLDLIKGELAHFKKTKPQSDDITLIALEFVLPDNL